MARKQQEKSRQTMEELLAAGEELFGAKGYFATSVAEITAHAGYAKGSFYRYFDSKDRLLLEILARKLAGYRKARDTEISRARDLPEALRIIWDFLETITRDRDWAKVMLEFTVHAARNKEIKAELGRSQYRLSEAVFAELIAPHVAEGFPSEKLAALNTALFEGFMVHNALDTGVLSLPDIREAAVTLAMAAVRDTEEENAGNDRGED